MALPLYCIHCLGTQPNGDGSVNRIHIENSAGLVTHKFDTIEEAENFMSSVEEGNPYGARIVYADRDPDPVCIHPDECPHGYHDA